MIELKFVDLFAGIGGFRQAASRVNSRGLQLVPAAACEIDKHCKTVYQDVFQTEKNQELFVDDVQEIVRGDGTEGHIELPSFDVLFGGFPCQPFSNVGKRKGLEDPRGALFFDIVKILRYYQPTFFVLENVSKIMTIDKGALLLSMVAELETAGYHVHYWDLYADQYGLPQKRHRLFFCGVKKSYAAERLELDAPEPVPREQWKYRTAWHLLERSMPPEHIIPEKTRETVLRPNPKWMGGLEIDLPTARPITASMAKWHRANQDNYYSEAYISSGNPNPLESPDVDWQRERIRRITPLEGFRLQGFPDEYASVCRRNGLSYTTTYKMIGNAVPVDLTACVIRHILHAYVNIRENNHGPRPSSPQGSSVG